MANRYFRNTGSTWNTSVNWSDTDGGPSIGAIPLTGDAVFFTANSSSCNLNSNTSCLSLNFTGYTGTFSGTFNVTVGGDIILSPTMTITATGILICNATTANLTSNGKTWTGTLQVNGSSKTYNFLDNWTVQNFTSASGTTYMVGTGTITVLGNFSNVGGTTPSPGSLPQPTVILAGTGTLSGAGGFGIAIIIDTLGTITFSGVVLIAHNFTYVRGTVITTGSTFAVMRSSASPNPTTIDLKGMILNTLQIGNTSSGTNTLFISGFTCTNLIYNNTSTAAVGLILTPGFLYRITTAFTAILTDGNAPNLKTIKSSIAGTLATLTLDVGATCNVGFYTFTDIDASGGRTIWVFGGIIQNCINVNPYNDPVITQAKSFVS